MKRIIAAVVLALIAISAVADGRRRAVSPRRDQTAPQLLAIWLDHVGMRGGERNTVFVQAADEGSGVALISGVFLSPTKHARIGFGCRAGANGNWECDFTPPVCIDCGNWQLEQLQLMDKANNFRVIRVTDDPLVAAIRVHISSDSCDSSRPVLTALVFDRNVISNAEANVISAIAGIADDGCGAASVSGLVAGPASGGASPRIYCSFSRADDTTWIAHISVPKLAAKGVWTVSWLQIIDKANNIRTYAQSDPELAGVTFRVE